MAKAKKRYVCQNCGYVSATWLGRCPSCGQWNTFVEEIQEVKKNFSSEKSFKSKPYYLSEIQKISSKRLKTNIKEFDRILGGGFVPGSLVLLSGDPGIGKSTLALQIVFNSNFKSLYVSGEESLEQVKIRSERLSSNEKENVLFLAENELENILEVVKEEKPNLVIIDSIQTLRTQKLESSPGSVSQIRETASQIQEFAKVNSIAFLLIGHITKDGIIAGPKVLEHIVDVVLYFSGDRNYFYRILRSEKNRFGTAWELAIFEMSEKGLYEILNPSEFFLNSNSKNLSGVAIASIMEGQKIFFIEVQALVSTAVYSSPQRVASGFDTKRLSMILAVLEKKLGVKLSTKDVFINIAGGLKINDPSIDLAVVISILSSNFDFTIPKNWAFVGEISLTGEIKPVYKVEKRIVEAEKLGFEKIFISKYNKIQQKDFKKIQIVKIEDLSELVKVVFK